ncbi:MAG: metallophosphoesterase family protein [Chloroflexi bacterium]|nr:metallophosphoesterase family protein [Chloroflexota bacterium]
MKLAIISDIHANLPALEAVLADLDTWHPDFVVVDGDVVNRGPRPRECLHRILERQEEGGWPYLLGNHEEYVLAHYRSEVPKTGPLAEVYRYSRWTLEQLGEDVRFILDLPFCLTLEEHTPQVYVTHASPLGTRDGLYPEMDDEEIRKRLPGPIPLLGVAHTHRPFIRRVDDTLVVNAGAVGLPFDGDWRASYARLWWDGETWSGRIHRLPYDRERAIEDFYTTGFLEEAGPLAQLILIELKEARSQLFQWTTAYLDKVLAGEMSVAEAVQEFLRSENLHPATHHRV